MLGWTMGVRAAGCVLVLAAGSAACVLVGCGQRGADGQAEETGTDGAVPADGASAPAGEAVSGAGEAEAESAWPWRVPEGWVLDPEPRRMRLATYVVSDESGDVEVAVTRFPGRVGGELANVNRWRGQMGLEPVDEAGLEGVIERFGAEGFDGYETRLESGSGVMLASAVYEAARDQTYFVRATVDDAAAADRIGPGVFGMARSIMGEDG